MLVWICTLSLFKEKTLYSLKNHLSHSLSADKLFVFLCVNPLHRAKHWRSAQWSTFTSPPGPTTECHRAQRSWSSSETCWDTTYREKGPEHPLWFTAGTEQSKTPLLFLLRWWSPQPHTKYLRLSPSAPESGGRAPSSPWMSCFSSWRMRKQWTLMPLCTRWDCVDHTWCRQR